MLLDICKHSDTITTIKATDISNTFQSFLVSYYSQFSLLCALGTFYMRSTLLTNSEVHNTSIVN